MMYAVYADRLAKWNEWMAVSDAAHPHLSSKMVPLTSSIVPDARPSPHRLPYQGPLASRFWKQIREYYAALRESEELVRDRTKKNLIAAANFPL